MTKYSWIGLCLCFGLTACGGGGGGTASSGMSASEDPIDNHINNQSLAALNLDSCKKKKIGQSCGEDITLWHKNNNGQRLIIKIKNPTDHEKVIPIKGVFANNARALASQYFIKSPINLNDLPASNIQFNQIQIDNQPKIDAIDDVIKKQNKQVDNTIKNLVEAYHAKRRHRRHTQNYFKKQTQTNPVLYQSRDWQVFDANGGKKIHTQLQGQAWINENQAVNVWVADNVVSSFQQDMKITQLQAQSLAIKFANQIYPYVTNLIGDPWGAEVPLSLVNNMLAPKDQDINIVLQDITPDGKPLGMVGYFASQNNFVKRTMPESNEALVFFVDAPTYGKLDASNQAIYAPMTMITLAHELQHMIQFYQKRIRHEITTPEVTWQNETASQAIAYLVDRKLYPDIQQSPSLKPNGEFNQSLGYAGCVMNQWGGVNDTCIAADHYPKALSFSMYLLHQYGPGIMKDWVQNDQNDGAAILSSLSKIGVKTSIPELLHKWALSTQLDAMNSIDGIGFPSNTSLSDYELKAVRPDAYPAYRGIVVNHARLQSLMSPYQFYIENSIFMKKEVSVPAEGSVDLMVLVNP